MYAAMIGAAASLAGSALQYKQNKRLVKDQMNWQNDFAQSNWRKQNLYNSPSMQMARLRSAGLNPNLIYQSGGALTGAGEITTPNPGQSFAPNYGESISHGVDLFNAQLQADSVQSAINVNNAEIENRRAQTANIRTDTLTKEITNKWLPKEKRSQIANLVANTNLINQQRDYYSKLTGLTSQQIDNAVLEYQHIDAQIKECLSRKVLTDDQAKQVRKMCKQIDRNTDLISAQYQKAVIESSLLSLQKDAYNEHNPYSLDYNSKLVDIKRIQQLVDQLQFENTDYGRSSKLLGNSWFDSIFKIGNLLKYEHNNWWK